MQRREDSAAELALGRAAGQHRGELEHGDGGGRRRQPVQIIEQAAAERDAYARQQRIGVHALERHRLLVGGQRGERRDAAPPLRPHLVDALEAVQLNETG